MGAILEAFTIPPFGENTYLFGDPASGEAVVIDPGGRVDEILRFVHHRGLRVTHILNTHAHIDHVLAVAELRFAGKSWAEIAPLAPEKVRRDSPKKGQELAQ